MLNHLRIQNFKGWKDTGLLKLAPITVFFGTNSSGKSSLGQFLMMLKQTANSPDRSRVLHPGDKNTPVDLGAPEDLAHGHDIKQPISFSLSWKRDAPLEISDVLSGATFRGKRVHFDTDISFASGKGVRAISSGFRYSFPSETEGEATFSAGMRPKGEKKGEFELTTERFTPVRKMGRAWPLSSPVRFFGFPDELIAYYQNADVLNDLAFDFQNLLQGISYLGPLREEPQRSYQWSGDTPEDVGVRGERWVNAFLAAEDRKLSGGFKQRAKAFDVWVAEKLKEMGLIHEFSVRPVKGTRDYLVKVKVTPRSAEVVIPDVGFGVSQVLPIIVQCFYAPKNSTVIIEQPELHLHPAVQQNLADLFVGATRAREGGSERNVQFILESHSEHFLRRLQRRVAEEQIPSDDVAIYFCEQQHGRSSIRALELDEYGNISNWPADFFGNQIEDVAQAQKAGIRRRRNANSNPAHKP